MQHGKKYLTPEGVEVSQYGMEVMNITQGMYEGYSHKGRATIDDGGKDAGIDRFAAPFTGKITWIQTTGDKTGVTLTSVNKVWTPYKGGSLQYVNIIFWHDNYTGDLWKGKIIPQGTPFYDEGTAGRATGNHIHLGVSFDKYLGTAYPMVLNSDGNWEIKNEQKVYDVFFVNDTTLKNGNGYPWKTYTAPVVQTTNNIIKFNLTIDGMWGASVQKALQKVMGTYADGIMSGQIKNTANRYIYAAKWGTGGSAWVKELQRRIGATQDGYIGPQTIKALQKAMGVTQTGIILAKNDPCVMEMQKRLNAGTFKI